jgi:hypothetical protein
MFDGTRGRLHATASRNGCTRDVHRGDDTASWLTIPDPGFAAACEADLADRANDPATYGPPAGEGNGSSNSIIAEQRLGRADENPYQAVARIARRHHPRDRVMATFGCRQAARNGLVETRSFGSPL